MVEQSVSFQEFHEAQHTTSRSLRLPKPLKIPLYLPFRCVTCSGDALLTFFLVSFCILFTFTLMKKLSLQQFSMSKGFLLYLWLFESMIWFYFARFRQGIEIVLKSFNEFDAP